MNFLLIVGLIITQMLPHRRVLLFYNESSAQLLEKQVAQLHSNEQGLKERDIHIMSVNMQNDPDKLCHKWKVDANPSFTIILVGRDGGEKLRSHELIALPRLFAFIDAMPMRKSEMRNQ